MWSMLNLTKKKKKEHISMSCFSYKNTGSSLTFVVYLRINTFNSQNITLYTTLVPTMVCFDPMKIEINTM